MAVEDLSRSYLQRDITAIRRREWLVLLKAGIALAFVAGLIVLRLVYVQ